MPSQLFEEILILASDPKFGEVGGSHAQKGMEYQRHWAIYKMLTLAKDGTQDFLLLFEVLQDIAILDSCDTPNSIHIYQVKKKDRNEWGWNDLTKLRELPKSATSKKPQPLSAVPESPLGKLYACVKQIKGIEASGFFVSNAGCNLSLANGGNAATSASCTLADLKEPYLSLLLEGLAALHATDGTAPNVTHIHIEKVNIPVNDPGTYLVGAVYEFLREHNPEHANQARSLVDALLVKIATLGAKTDKCKTFDQLKQRQGFSKREFFDAVGSISKIPDMPHLLDTWIEQLGKDGLGIIDRTAIRSAAVGFYSRQLIGSKREEEILLEDACDKWLEAHAISDDILQYFESAYAHLQKNFSQINKSMFFAVLAIKAIRKCVDQN